MLVVGSALVFAASCLVFAVSTRVVHNPPAWYTFEFCQYAEIGRNLAETGRFATNLVEPMALAVLDAEPPGRPRFDGLWPVVNRYPLPCLVVAGLMKLFGTTDGVAAWSNGLAVALLGAIGFAACARWFGAVWGTLFAVIFLANPAFFAEFALLGTPDIWFAAVFLAELLVWSEFNPKDPDPRPRWRWAVGLGLLAGLGFLARFNATMFFAFQALALVRWRRWRELLTMMAVALAVASPMLLYNLCYFGRPLVSVYSAWNLLDDIGAYRVEPWLYYHVPRLGEEMVRHAGGVWHKFVTNLYLVIPGRVWNLWRLNILFPLALATAAIFRPCGTAYGRFAAWSTGLFLLQLVTFAGLRLELEPSVSPHHGRYFFWYAVPAVLLPLGLLRSLTRVHRLWWLVVAPVLLVQLAWFVPPWRRTVADHAVGTNLGHDPIRDMVRQVCAGRVVASNQPQVLSWFCGVRSISLPANPAELLRLNRESPTPADFLFVDVNFNAIDLDPDWGRLATHRPGVFSPWEPALLRDYEYVLPPDRTRGLDYVILRRRSVPPNADERRIRALTRRS